MSKIPFVWITVDRVALSLMGPLFISPDDGRINMEQRRNDNREGETEVLEYKHFPLQLRQPHIPKGLS